MFLAITDDNKEKDEGRLQLIIAAASNESGGLTIDDGAKSYSCLLVIVFQHNGFHSIVE